MAILPNVLVFLIALTVAGILPAAHSMPADEADAACAAQNILCGTTCAPGALCAAVDNALRGGVVAVALLPVLSASFGAPGLTRAPETAPPKLLLT